MKKFLVVSLVFIMVLCISLLAVGCNTRALDGAVVNTEVADSDSAPQETSSMVLEVLDGEILLSATETVVNPDGSSSQTLTAIVNAAEFTDTSVTWSAAWSNPAAEWVNDSDQVKTVNDYLVLLPAADDPSSCEVNLRKPIGAQITITVTSVFNPSIKTTATVDYIKRVTGVKMGKASQVRSLIFGDDSDSVVTNELVYSVELGTGTIEGTYSFDKLYCSISSSAYDALASESSTLSLLGRGSSVGYNGQYDICFDSVAQGTGSVSFALYFKGKIVTDSAGTYNSKEYVDVHDVFATAESIAMYCHCSIKNSYNGVTVQTYKGSVSPLGVSDSLYNFVPSMPVLKEVYGITLSSSSLVF